MTSKFFAALCTLPLALAACDMNQTNQAGAAAAGGVIGYVTAQAFDANPEWTVLTTLAGAAAGTMVAQHRNGNCAYARGDGTYYTAAC